MTININRMYEHEINIQTYESELSRYKNNHKLENIIF